MEPRGPAVCDGTAQGESGHVAGKQGLSRGAQRTGTHGWWAWPAPLSPVSPQGFSAHWWNFRHFQHHAKPNVSHKDPDVTLAPIFLLGESSVEVRGEGVGPTGWASRRRGAGP